MTIEQKLLALMEGKKEKSTEDSKEQVDQIDQEPAVKIDNPLDPDLENPDNSEQAVAPEKKEKKIEESVDVKKLNLSEQDDLKDHQIEKLVNDEDFNVRYNIAKHPNLKDHHIEKLVNDENSNVRARISLHPNLKDHHIEKLVNDEDSNVRANIAKHPNIKDHHIEKLVNDENRNVRYNIAKHPNLKDHQIDKLVNDKDWLVRETVTKHPNLKDHQIKKINQMMKKLDDEDDEDELSDHRGHFNNFRNPFNESYDKKKIEEGSYSSTDKVGGDSFTHGDWTVTLHAAEGNNGASIVARHKDGGSKLNLFSGSVQHADSFFNHPTHLKKTIDILSGKMVESEELSEEFQAQAAALFEEKVQAKAEELIEEKLDTKVSVLKEEFETLFEEHKTKYETELVEKIDEYFDQLSEQWMKDNELALEAGLRSEMTESFMNGLKNLFESHYIEIPLEKVDVVNSLEEQKAELEEKLSDTQRILEEHKKELLKTKREIILENMTKSMTEIDSGKFRIIMEEFQIEDIEAFEAKANSVKETFFGANKKEINLSEAKLNMSSKPLVEEKVIEAKPSVESKVTKYAQEIRKFQRATK